MIDAAPGSLLEGLKTLFATLPGAPVRDQLLASMNVAHCTKLEASFVKAAASAVQDFPNTLERNLDLVKAPPQPLWVEWNEVDRSGEQHLPAGMSLPIRVGALIIPDEANPDLVGGMFAWENEGGQVDHAPAFFLFSLSHLADLAYHARNFFSQVPIESRARLLSVVLTDIPADFVAEMEVMQGLRPDDLPIETQCENARKVASTEAFFVLATLLLMQSENAAMVLPSRVDQLPSACLVDPTKSRWDKFGERYLRRQYKGFRRHDRKAGATVSWHPSN
jgi:hypothetical protein